MTFTISGQAASFCGALLLGAAAGVVYDLFRVLRWRLKSRFLGGALDLLFWLGLTAILFFYCVAAGNGVVRLYMMAAMLGGGVVYFLLLSPLVLKAGFRLADLVAFCVGILLWPGRALAGECKKLLKSAKNHFHYWRKWVTIKAISNEQQGNSLRRNRHRGAKWNEGKNQIQTRRLSDQDHRRRSAGVHGSHPDEPGQ